MAPPLVGIVVAAYEAERFLGPALDSVAAQTFPGWCCVVVDDGSTDRTAEVASSAPGSDPRFSLLRQANAGVGAARNAGLGALPPEASHVLFLDSDDTLVPDALEALLGGLRRRPDAVGATGWAADMDEGGAPLEPAGPSPRRQRPVGAGLRTRILDPLEDTTFESLLLHGSASPPATVLARRDVVERAGAFDPSLRCSEDGDLWLRATMSGPLVFVDGQVAWYRRHPAGATRLSATCLRSGQLIRAKAYRHPQASRSQRRAVVAANARRQGWEAARSMRRARAAMSEGRAGAFAWAATSGAIAAAQMIVPRPLVPPAWWAEAVVSLNDRCGFDRSGRW